MSDRPTGDTVVTNAQTAASGIVLAQGDGASIESVNAGPITGSTVTLDGNTMTGKARANSATLTLAPESAVAVANRSISPTAGSTAIDAGEHARRPSAEHGQRRSRRQLGGLCAGGRTRTEQGT